jgi:hypothetical protein
MTTIDTQACRRGGELSSSDPAGDQMICDVLEAIEHGIDTASYIDARSAGATHEQVVDVSTWEWPDFNPLHICTRILRCGATFEELCAFNIVASSSVEPPGLRALAYANALEGGLTRSEFLYYDNYARHAAELKYTIEDVLESGISHSRIVAFHDAGGHSVHWYTSSLRQGASDQDVLEVVAIDGAQLEFYARALKAGVTHTESIEVLAKQPGDMYHYGTLRAAGVLHERAMQSVAIQR